MTRTIFTLSNRNRIARWILGCVLAVSLPVMAQDAQPGFPVLPNGLEKQLASKASNVSEVTLNKNMLNFAGQFMNSKKEDDVEGKRLIQKLNAIYVRDYEFKDSGAYSLADLQAIRHEFLGPQWNSIVRERSKNGGDNTDVYIKLVNGQIHGMFVLSAEPKELSLVYIDGTIDPHELGELSGNFGIPKVKMKAGDASLSTGGPK